MGTSSSTPKEAENDLISVSKLKILDLCSGLLLKDGKIEYEYKKPFDTLVKGNIFFKNLEERRFELPLTRT